MKQSAIVEKKLKALKEKPAVRIAARKLPEYAAFWPGIPEIL